MSKYRDIEPLETALADSYSIIQSGVYSDGFCRALETVLGILRELPDPDVAPKSRVLKEFIDTLHRELRMYGQDDKFNKTTFLTIAENIVKEMSTK